MFMHTYTYNKCLLFYDLLREVHLEAYLRQHRVGHDVDRGEEVRDAHLGRMERCCQGVTKASGGFIFENDTNTCENH